MACCLTAPSHYLNRCWLIISKVEWHSSTHNGKGGFTRDTSAINQWNYLENEVPNISFKFPRANELIPFWCPVTHVRSRCSSQTCQMYHAIFFRSMDSLSPVEMIFIRTSWPREIWWWFNTLRPRRNEQHLADDIFKHIFFNENSMKKFLPKGPINNIPALVQIMAWRHSGAKPLSEPMMISLPTHIYVTRPQRVKCCVDHTSTVLNVVFVYCGIK